MKYNWGIIGHEKQLVRIEADIESENLSHAYILAGTDSVGKFSIAKKMAGILQCENDFCHKCPTCLQVKNGNHLDTMEFADDGESIKIEQVRNIIDRLSMTGQSRYKIVLIENMERMTLEAANSFLKILEEPPVRTIFIMTTDDIRLLLSTVISRVRVIKFSSLPVNYLMEKLHELYPEKDAEAIKHASLLSLGKTGKAVDLIEQPEMLASYTKAYFDVQNFLERRNIVDRFSYVAELDGGDDRRAIFSFLEIMTHVVRTKLLEGGIEKERGMVILSKAAEAGKLIRKNVNVKLVLENLMLQL